MSWQPLHHPQCRVMSKEEAYAWYWQEGAEILLKQYAEEERKFHKLSWMLRRWELDPICFSVEGLRTKPMPYQAGVLLDMADAPLELYKFYGCNPEKPKRQCLIPSGHGLGKTRLLATAIWWHLITRQFSYTLCTAPSSQQLTGRLWSECRKLYRRLKQFWSMLACDWEIQTSSIIHINPDYGDWCATARTARPERPEALQGAHALDDDDSDGQLATIFGDETIDVPSGGILVIIEEASGVDDTIREVVEGALSEPGARLLAPGNPTKPDGWFADDMDKPERYAIHSLDCRQSDRTKIYSLPWRDTAGTTHQLQMHGFVEPRYWEDILTDCDGDEDADRFRVRVKGQKPRSAFDACIKSHWVESAQDRKNDPDSKSKPVIIGLDFGLFSDKHALAARQGFNQLEGQEWLPKDTPDEITLDAADRAIEAQELFGASYIIGDSNGVGNGAMSYLTRYYREHPELNVTVIHFNAGQGALDNSRYFRKRDQMWHKYGRQWIANPRCSLLKIPGLKQQLTSPGYYEDTNKRIQVESKKELKARNIESSNLADALLETLMVHVPQHSQHTKQEKDYWPQVFKRHFDRIKFRQQTGIIH